MYPFIIEGDVLTVAPLSQERLRLGDIVACCSPESGRLVIHRVVARRRDAVLLRGDNSTGPDGLTGMAAVLGRVARVERHGRELACGRGPERLIIAALSRRGALVPLACVVRRVVWPVMLRARARDGRRSR